VLDADTIDPGVNFSHVNVQTGVQFGAGLGDHLGFPGEPALLLCLGLRFRSASPPFGVGLMVSIARNLALVTVGFQGGAVKAVLEYRPPGQRPE